MHLEFIKQLLRDQKDRPNAFKRNLVKEYLQILALSFIYSHDEFRKLVFYGGSCLMHCFGLERLSEDLDLVDLEGTINTEDMARELSHFFGKELGEKISCKKQKFRVYLKIPILSELDLAETSGSDLLFIKVEIYKGFTLCKDSEIQIHPIFKFGRSLLIRTFDLPTLMSTKILAILQRQWEKNSKDGTILCAVKGRDYYDLLWYLKRGIKPNLHYFKDIKTKESLKKLLISAINKADSKSIRFDLEAFIADTNFVDELSNNLRNILLSEIENI